MRKSDCTLCGESVSEIIPATEEHTVVKDLAVEASCTEGGLTEGSHCSVCDLVLVAQQSIDPLGHVGGEWTVITPATYNTDGERQSVCTACNEIAAVEVIYAFGSEGLEYIENEDGTLSVASIGSCTDVDIYIPRFVDGKRVKEILSLAFDYSPDLQSVTVADGLELIGEGAFKMSYKLTEVNIGKIGSIGKEAFRACYSLQTVTIADGAEVIENMAFYDCRQLSSITLPNSIKSIGASCFYMAQSLDTIDLPEELEYIGDSVFRDSGVEKNEDYYIDGNFYVGNCFIRFVDKGNYGQQVYVIEEGTRIIAPLAFYDNAYGYLHASKIVIPDSVKYICREAFRGCDRVTEIVMGNGIVEIGEWAFTSSAVTELILPETVEKIASNALEGVTMLERIVVDEDNPNFMSVDGHLYSKDGARFLQYSIGREESEYTILPTVTVIDSYAFSYAENLVKVNIPDGVYEIGKWSFSGCKAMTEINLPKSLQTIGYRGFHGCSGIETLKIPDGMAVIGEYAFYLCSGIKNVYIPLSVTDIEPGAFYQCPAITDVYYAGNKEDWIRIYIHGNNRGLEEAQTYHYNWVDDE